MRKLLLSSLCLCLLGGIGLAQKSVTIKSGELSLRTDTRVTMEGAIYLPEGKSDDWKWEGEAFRFANGANITQARFGVWASLGDRWTGKIDFKIADRQILPQDIFLDYKVNPKNLYIRAGYYVDPVSVEANAASSFLSLNTPTVLSMLSHQTRFLGVSLTSYGKHHYIVGGLYGSSLGSKRNLANRGSDGWGITLRGAYVPINEARRTLYLGAYARYRTPDVSITGRRDALSFSTHSGSTIDRRNFIGGTLTGVKSYSLYGAEFALTLNKFHLMGEYLTNNIYFDKDNPYNRTRAFFHGGYVTASYMLWGRQRKYLNYWGIFSPLANQSTEGALELIARLSIVHGNDTGNKDKGEQAINLGRSTVGTLGLNWYPYGSNLLVGLNYNYSAHDEYASAGGKFSYPYQDAGSGFGFHSLQCRLQFIF